MRVLCRFFLEIDHQPGKLNIVVVPLCQYKDNKSTLKRVVGDRNFT